MAGPEQTPYEGGSFTLKLVLGNEFPAAPPKGTLRRLLRWKSLRIVGNVSVSRENNCIACHLASSFRALQATL